MPRAEQWAGFSGTVTVWRSFAASTLPVSKDLIEQGGI